MSAATWFAVQTRSRHEKKVVAELEQRGITSFLPLIARVSQWSDRRKVVELPLFPGYVFVHIVAQPKVRLSVLTIHGVAGFVGTHGQGTPIPTTQVEDLRTLLLNKIDLYPRAFLSVGRRVRICSGALSGIEGIVVAHKGARQLVVSIQSIERSVSLSLEGYDVEPV